MCHGLERDSASIHAVRTTVPSVLKCGLTLVHKAGQCVAHTACRCRCSVRLERGFGGKPCHTCRSPEACPTRIRKGLRLVAPLAPVPKAQDRRPDRSAVITRSVMATFWACDSC